MKITLAYDRPATIQTDLLVVMLDEGYTFHDLSRSRLGEMVDRIEQDFKDKKLHTSYFTGLEPRESKAAARYLLVHSTSLNRAYNVWENLKTFVAKSLRTAQDYGLKNVTIVLNTEAAAPFVGKAVEGAILGGYSFDRYKQEKSKLDSMEIQIAALEKHAESHTRNLTRYTLVSDAVNEARTLINEPGGVVNPEYVAQAARKVAKECDLDIKVWDEKQLRKEGYNGLISVGKGSASPPRMIRMAYRARKAKHHLALVGKGVTFDTGGISLKPADKMWEMKGDMSGGAAVIYALKAIAKLRPNINVTGIVPTAENAPDAHAQRPGDIFFAKNGKSIMVDNTDAEGRLILTDGLSLAGEVKATHILDIATLTGAVVRALGESIAGVMGNNPELVRAVIQSGRNHGETFWELPLPPEYKELLKTPCADLNNIGGPVAGALTAGLFLQEFVPEGTPWAHLDIAGPFIKEKEWKYYEAGGIGFGLKTMVDVAERFGEYF